MTSSPTTQPVPGPAYPPAPWALSGQNWLTLFGVRRAGRDPRPGGLYAVAFVDYQEPSPLVYSELLAARLVRDGRGRRLTITDIWVDSPASMAGGRDLWAIPKQLCDFRVEPDPGRGLAHTALAARTESGLIAEAAFADVSGLGPRVPFALGIRQTRAGGDVVRSPLAGSARGLPARAHWRFAPDGPLAWLGPARQLGSYRLRDFTMDFG